MGIELNKDQLNASLLGENWWHSSTEQTFQISGAAGTGKTTLVKYLIERIGLVLDDVLFVTYMGKAATCLQRNGLPAKTIHSAIYKYEKKLVRDENGKIVLDDKGFPKYQMHFVLRDKIGDNVKLIVVDEGSTVPAEMAVDLLSFGIPVIVLGDLNQLPPVFGNAYFLNKPDIILRQIMRQAANSPIVYLSQRVLANDSLIPGKYGDSTIIPKNGLNPNTFKKADIVLTFTNKLRSSVNNKFREELTNIKDLTIPNRGEKVICRKNDWNKCIGGIYMTNGMTGFIDHIDLSTLKKGTVEMDFRPDFSVTPYKFLKVDYNTLMGEHDVEDVSPFNYSINRFEFAYAITTHLSQGSQWDDVLLLTERTSFSPDIQKKLLYTAITRAAKNIVIAV